MDYIVITYGIYTAAAIGLTGVLARTLFRNGKIFLEDVFRDQPGMAEAVNHLLVVGFYMLNLGYAFMIFRTEEATTGVEATEVLVSKLGVLLVSLGIIHFVNIFVFWRMRSRHQIDHAFPPIAPTGLVAAPPAPVPTAH